MSSAVYFIAISSLINGIGFAVLGLLTFLNNPKRKVNRLFALFSASVAFWAIIYFIWLFAKDYDASLFWIRTLNFISVFIPVLSLHWTLALLEIDKEKKNKIILIFSYIATFIFGLFAFTDYYISHVTQESFFLFWPKPGILYHFYIAMYGCLISYSTYCLIKHYKTAVSFKKAQIKYVLLGVIIGAVGGAPNYPLFYGIQIPPFGNSLIIAWPILFSYSMLRYRFMDIRWAMGRAGIYFFASFIILFYSFFAFFINQQLNIDISPLILGPFVVVTASFLFTYLLGYLEKLAGKYFYYTFYTLKNTLKDLTGKLNQVIELGKLTDLINRSLLDALKLDKIGVVFKNPGKKIFNIQTLIKFQKEDILSLLSDNDNFLPEYLQKTEKPLITEEIPFIVEEIKKTNLKEDSIKTITNLLALKKSIGEAGAALFLPLLIKGKLIGVIILGGKLSQDAYTVQDINLLKTLISQASIAFNNALSYEEINQRKADLERFYKLTVGRELKMAELKKDIKRLQRDEKS